MPIDAGTGTAHTYEEEVARLDNTGPEDWRDAVHMRAIIAGRKDVAAAENKLREAVAAARAAGDPWVIIGAALEINQRAVIEKYGQDG